jgi:hypothetical protein
LKEEIGVVEARMENKADPGRRSITARSKVFEGPNVEVPLVVDLSKVPTSTSRERERGVFDVVAVNPLGIDSLLDCLVSVPGVQQVP